MKTVLATVMAMALAAGTCSMVSADEKLTPQQEKMKACNAQAADKKGDERKAFMSTCLKAGRPAAQEKMKAGKTKAGEKKGDERKTFMSECLKADKKS